MLDRRAVLLSGAASAALAATPVVAKAAAAAAAPANSEATKMNAMFDQFMNDVFDQAPEFTTNLGIDKGDRAYQRSLVSDRSLAQVDFFKRLNTDQLAKLKTIKRDKLTGMDAVNYDVVMYGLQQQEDDNKRFN